MAEKENKDESKETEATSGKKGGLVGWVITFVVAILCSVGGYGLSGLFAKAAPEKIDPEVEAKKDYADRYLADNPDKPWIFQLDPITANLNEASATRMIQLTVVLELSEEMDKVKGEIFLKEKVIHLQDWLGTYLAGMKLMQVKGGSSQSRMKVDICENFNSILFPDTKPMIQRVMLKDFIIQ